MDKYVPKKYSREVGINARHPLLSFRNDIEDLFGSLFNAPSNAKPLSSEAFIPKLDIEEGSSGYTVTAELPGMGEDDIEVTVDEDVLTIRGEKKKEVSQEKDGRYYSERSWGSFERRLHLSDLVDSEQIDAAFSAGVLTITLPKLAEEKRQSRKISVRSE